jgi:putative transposase
MVALLTAIVHAIVASLRPRASLVAENLALRQQVAVLRRAAPRRRLRPVDRAFWVVLSRTWSRWAETVVIVKPETVIGWHRRGFVRFWARRSRRAGRPPLDPMIVELIVRMAQENPTWSRRRIASELAKLGHAVSKDTVARYMPRRRPRSRPPSQTWTTFIRNHLPGTLAIDFLTVPTATFGVLSVFFVLSLERRRVLHVNVTAHPYAAWAAQQMIEAVAPDVVAERVIRDRDRIFGAVFDRRLVGMGLEQFRIAPRAPWQNGFAERFVGTIRRELLDHVIILGERPCSGSFVTTPGSTTTTGPIWRSTATLPPDERWRALSAATWSRSLASAGSTTATREQPDQRRNEYFATTGLIRQRNEYFATTGAARAWSSSRATFCRGACTRRATFRNTRPAEDQLPRWRSLHPARAATDVGERHSPQPSQQNLTWNDRPLSFSGGRCTCLSSQYRLPSAGSSGEVSLVEPRCFKSAIVSA